ncbi:flagellar assembly protein A [Sulfurimonas sp.]|uniref:flagellar assembly protein A n=1 Tax=Sulfurimonas sp. TaxID=2022749 RepID=UPI0025FFD8BA|nr:flagellar assembly protein A [Sulfurimonas sp.]
MTCLLSKKVKTKNIESSLRKFALENKLPLDKLSFDINKIETYIKTVADDDFVLYEKDIHHYYSDYDKMINEHVNFRQFYIITIKQEPTTITLNYEILYSENSTSASIVIFPDSIIKYKNYTLKELYFALLSEINKIKAKNNILINIFDKQMLEQLKKFTHYIIGGKFVKKIKLPLFNGVEPEITRNSKLILHYREKDKTHQVVEVNEGEILVEFLKPIFGKNGLNVFGETVSNDLLINKNDLSCRVDKESIEIIEETDRKIYKSKKKGYIHIDDNDFYIDNKIKINNLSRIDNSIAKDEKNNIEVIISQDDATLDSLGEGVNLTSEVIHIAGHVGAKSTLKAVSLTIDGATHQDSLQEAKFAMINRHKGKLRCHSAKIKLLEGGEVRATNVEIDSCMGGTIYAETVTIGQVKNNLKVYASNSITIRLVSGENNLFKISYKDIPTLNSRFNYLASEMEDLKYTLEGALKHSLSQVSIIKEEIQKIKLQQDKIVDCVKTAKITIKEPFMGINTITFVIDSNNELTFKTEEKLYDSFYLEESDLEITLHPTNKKISIKS